MKNRLLKYFAGIILLNFMMMNPNPLTAQDEVTFTASGPNVVQAGEYFRVSYVVNAKAEEFNGPKINDFEFNGPMLSTSMSTQIINNKVSQSATYTYNYTMVASKPGVYSLDPATVKVKGKTYRSNSLKIEVVQANPANNQGTARRAEGTDAAQSQNQVSGQDLFTRIEVDKKNVYKGQQIIATIKIYTRLNLARFGEIKIPSFSGFWNQEIPTPNQISLERQNVNGTLYNVGVIKKSVLVPQQTGEIQIDPFEIECFVNVARQRSRSTLDDFFMDDFFGNYQTVSKKIVSPSVSIQVKPLPSPIPEGFTGGVGKLSITSEIDKNEIKTNEAITLKVTVKGNGNLKLIEMPKLQFPTGLEVYDPRISNDFQAGSDGINGSKTFEYLIIPRLPDQYHIKNIAISWFDPTSEKYETREIAGFDLSVVKSEEDSSPTVVSGLSREDVRVLGQDIRFIKTSSKFKAQNKFFYGSFLFWLLYLSGIVLFFVILITGKIRMKQKADVLNLRSRRALNAARKKIARAQAFAKSGKKAEALDVLLKLIWGYLGDRLQIEPSLLDIDRSTELLKGKGIGEEIISELNTIIETCQYQQYAPGFIESDLNSLIAETLDMLSRLERLIKK